jgi:hypothetical protein
MPQLGWQTSQWASMAMRKVLIRINSRDASSFFTDGVLDWFGTEVKTTAD